MVARISDLIGLDTEQTQILKNGLLKLLLLLGWVCVIKPNNKLPIAGSMCKIVVEKSSLRMADMEIPSV